MADLLINNVDADTLGIKMGDGFLDELEKPSPMKEYIENKSRLNHGKTVITTNAKVDERDLTLTFNLEGSSQSDYETKRKTFYNLLYAGTMTIKVPPRSEDVYHLTYTGKSISYAGNAGGTFSKVSVKFCEPNPMNRV